MSISNEKRPKKWADYQGHKYKVEYLKSIISKNTHPECLWITGPPGSGKSTMAKLYYKSIFCLNRREGESEPCGECDVCTDEIKLNIHEYVANVEFEKVVPEIKELIYSLPSTQGERLDQYRRVIIIDELQELCRRPALISAFLDPLEYCPATTTVVLISMDRDKFDPITLAAIEGRAQVIPLSKLSESVITKNLVDNYSQLDIKTAKAIAKFSSGDMRKAWSHLEYFMKTHSDVSLLTEERVYEDIAGGATPYTRLQMWEALSLGDYKAVKDIFKNWVDIGGIREDLLADILLNDVIDNLGDNFLSQSTLFLSSIGGWLKTIHRPPLLSLVLTFLNNSPINKNTITTLLEKQSTSTITVNQIDIDEIDRDVDIDINEQIEVDKVEDKAIEPLPWGEEPSEKITEQLNQMLGEELTDGTDYKSNSLSLEEEEEDNDIPLLFRCRTFAELVKAYMPIN